MPQQSPQVESRPQVQDTSHPLSRGRIAEEDVEGEEAVPPGRAETIPQMTERVAMIGLMCIFFWFLACFLMCE